MTKLKELEKRLKDEPDNLGLRVMVAGALHDAGRRDEAIELYRSVAVAYRDQGRPQQAISVCRSVLELAPADASCRELLAALLASQPAPRESPPPSGRLTPSRLPSPARSASAPARRSSGEVTPLPPPLAYHDADPTTGARDLEPRSELPASLHDELASYPEIAGIANAARQISASLIAASRLDEPDHAADGDLAAERATRRMPRIGLAEHARMPGPPPAAAQQPERSVSVGDDDDRSDDEPTLPPPLSAVPRVHAVDDEKTLPRELPGHARPPSIAPPTAATGPLTSAFFVPVPPRNRAAVLQRFRRRMTGHGTTVIQRGESGHGLVIVVRGRLEVHADRASGARVSLGTIGPGEYVGEASLLARGPAGASVVAGLDSELLVLAAADFYEVTGAFPALWAELTSVAERRAREHAQRLQV